MRLWHIFTTVWLVSNASRMGSARFTTTFAPSDVVPVEFADSSSSNSVRSIQRMNPSFWFAGPEQEEASERG
ncbi:uncharacterized protein LAESUDRAFT_730773 [Laetiporus sulphureus 93-53]|uniref:Secreted protein n=1 Tax=Laetiporus sulphureus 93-53 TaxID=1314785 RepID=A0A165BYF5_9APHY|nr:uncharacterized protein LAESUDRAFT_730773 [Laetiporus sulphureus 93-53]KZT01876.1 hypothetical protein LAESUDRAFT_730773 [Laetiporus sulphureus 93-53]